MYSIAVLNELLQIVRKATLSIQRFTGSPAHALINALYGFPEAVAGVPERSWNEFIEAM